MCEPKEQQEGHRVIREIICQLDVDDHKRSIGYAVQFADAGYLLIIECHGGNWPIIGLIETNLVV